MICSLCFINKKSYFFAHKGTEKLMESEKAGVDKGLFRRFPFH